VCCPVKVFVEHLEHGRFMKLTHGAVFSLWEDCWDMPCSGERRLVIKGSPGVHNGPKLV
jgi:hypothetical protein